MDPKQWRPLYKREVKAVEWLLKHRDVELLALYWNGPNTKPKDRIKHGKLPELRLQPKDVLDGAWGIRYLTDEDLQLLGSAPKQQIKDAGMRLTKPAGQTYNTIWNALPRAVATVPRGTKDLTAFLYDWAQKEHAALLAGIEGRAQALRTPGLFYHAGRRGYSLGHIIKPYFEVQQTGMLKTSAGIERAFESARPGTGAQIPRLGTAYAFEEPRDAVQYAYGGGRQLYSVEPLGPIERHDMMCIDEFEGLVGSYRGLADGADDETLDAEEAEWDADFAELSDLIADAYWRGRPCPRTSGKHGHLDISPDPPVWEVLCAQGFKVVAVEDPMTIDETRLRMAVRAMLLAASS